MTHSRRQFLRRTAATTTGLGVLGATAGNAAAYSIPMVSTRDHFDDDGDLVSVETATSYDTVGAVPGTDAACTGDVLVFAHGWTKNSDTPEQDAKEKFAEVKGHLQKAGYGGTFVGYTWDNDAGGGIDFGWGEAQDVAQANGAKLAHYLLDLGATCSGADIRLLSHSLGAQVVLSTLRYLQAWEWDRAVTSLHLMGAAQDNEAPSTEWPDTYTAIRDYTGETYNYYSEADDVLQWVYNTFEWDQALGETGLEDGNTAPGNYVDYDGTSQVGDDHSAYSDTLADEIVAHMR